ncbi:hypothetical protein SAMN00790413_01217 [Deinococcus hopiensis KR-140]|uniref:Uncharacterized protein n=1 Tax=Deinococcus hopiensis KR-140 TaxID=695939 RepID=A0A1W1VE70_9DEIO|nr:hypothetical protein SAMN00790413_01217 [Deinococcus hopiensis KR-140]
MRAPHLIVFEVIQSRRTGKARSPWEKAGSARGVRKPALFRAENAADHIRMGLVLNSPFIFIRPVMLGPCASSFRCS